MVPLVLYRIDAKKNVYRYYRLAVEIDLWGEWRLVRSWGRKGSRGRTLSEPFPTFAEAFSALEYHHQRRGKRGYVEAP